MPKGYHVEVTGWTKENESVSWDGYGFTEEKAIEDAKIRGKIIEIGDVTILSKNEELPPRLYKRRIVKS